MGYYLCLSGVPALNRFVDRSGTGNFLCVVTRLFQCAVSVNAHRVVYDRKSHPSSSREMDETLAVQVRTVPKFLMRFAAGD